MNRDVIEFSIEQLDRLNDMNIEFEMAFWANNTTTHPLNQPEPVECGFAGCFLGWAAHQQWFDQFGLKLRLDVSRAVGVSGNEVAVGNVHLAVEGGPRDPVVGHNAAYGAVENLFDIRSEALEFVVLPDQYDMPSSNITPGVVADRLRRLLEIGDEAFCEEMTERLREYTNDYEDDDQ